MQKPSDWDNVSSFGEFKQLPKGAYICKVCKVEETESKGGYPMLRIYLDIAEGEYKDFYAQAYRADKRDDKKWGCIYYQLTQDTQNHSQTNRGLKTFVTSVEESNNGFKVVWGDAFADCFKNKKVGVVFRREQFQTMDGKLMWSVKPFNFRSVDAVYKGIEPPEDKAVSGYTSAPAQASTQQSTQGTLADIGDFEEVISNEAELPF